MSFRASLKFYPIKPGTESSQGGNAGQVSIARPVCKLIAGLNKLICTDFEDSQAAGSD